MIHKKTKWVNVKILVWLMQMIHWSLRHVRGLYDVVIMLDVLAVHFSPELLQCMDTLSFRYMFIPAKLTWLIQPCDTHCFALYKRFLKLIVLRHRARSRFSEVPAVPVWFQFIADTIVHHMNQRSWVAAFRENGFGDSQMQVSAFIKRHLASTTFLPVSVLPHDRDILDFISPSNRTTLPVGFCCLTSRSSCNQWGRRTGSSFRRYVSHGEWSHEHATSYAHQFRCSCCKGSPSTGEGERQILVSMRINGASR